MNEPAVALRNFKKDLTTHPHIRHLKQRVDDLQGQLTGQDT
jgi:hypothetical protein